MTIYCLASPFAPDMESSASLPPKMEHAPIDLFPHADLRPGQDLFLEDARSCFASGTHLLAHAPMGLGKTAVSLAAGLETSLTTGAHLLFTTARQSHHTIAMDTIRLIWQKKRFSAIDLVSRNDMCLARKKGWPSCISSGKCYFLSRKVEEAAERLLAYPLHVQEAMRLCLRLGACPYLAAQKAADQADVVVGDYNLLFRNDTSERNGPSSHRTEQLVIVDEGHNLPARIVDANSGELTGALLERSISSPSLRRYRDDLITLEREFRRLTSGKGRARIDPWELDETLAQNCGAESGPLAEELRLALSPLDVERHRPLLEFLECWSAYGSSSVRFSEPLPARLTCRLLEPSLVAGPIFDRISSALVMSGTLHPPEMFADILGLADRCALRRYRSPFPSENRLVLVAGDVSSRFRLRGESMYANIARKLVQASEVVPGNLAAFFPSYDFMNGVAFQMRKLESPKRMVSESRELSKNERDAMVMDLRRERDALLMATLGGSFAEGIDFSGNLLSAVVVVGFPLGPPNLESEALRARLQSKHGLQKAMLYSQTYPAISKVLQAAGRAIRSEKDRAAILLLDDRYLLPSVKSSFPDDFRPLPAEDLRASLGSFFSSVPNGHAPAQ